MRWLDVSTENCSLQATLDVVGHKWSLLVLRETFNGVHRFEEMRQHLDISEAVLTRRLRELIDAGILQARAYRIEGQRPRREYLPTDAGWELLPVVVALLRWGDRHLGPGAGGSWEVRHRECGTPVEVAIICPEHPGISLGQRMTITNPGPAARPRTDRAS